MNADKTKKTEYKFKATIPLVRSTLEKNILLMRNSPKQSLHSHSLCPPPPPPPPPPPKV